MTTVQIAAPPEKAPPRFIRALKAMRDRRMAAMFLLALAAGLPYGAVVGTLNAWLTTEGVTPSTIGVLAILTIGYSFKFLWSPAFQTAHHPFPFLGPRRTWLLSLQLPIAGLLFLLAFSNPGEHIGFVAVIALLTGLFSATHDIVLDAWRIEVARSEEDKDLMAALYQFGYRIAGFVTGFLALLLAGYYGWVVVYVMIAVMMLLSISGTLLAPEPEIKTGPGTARLTFQAGLPERERTFATVLVATGWVAAFVMIATFVIASLTQVPPPKAGAFVTEQGPWIVGLTVLLPAAGALFLLLRHGREPAEIVIGPSDEPALARTIRAVFRSIFDPLMDLIARLGWGALLVLLLALTYRFTDSVWGSFAYPFYLDDRFGALHHSMADVAVASKFFGVLMTVAGAALGAVVISFVGRMPVLVAGAVLAAATNLLFADLSRGGAGIDAFLEWTRIADPLRAFAAWSSQISPDAQGADAGERMARLMIAIAGENLAGGFASVAVVAFLTSVVNPRFAAVQYALLASLTMLIGTLGRPWLGAMIESQGYHAVFLITFWLGGVAVVLSVIEWIRQARLAVPQEPAPAA
ncbi:AmpG family muropeptide MFS transporter [Hyphomonas sp.]|uniref:AmpG family muropeptide MFS transporter n=1 Tax=Hyphomonas sp. TaxID=87 RepID=UPI00391C18E6